MCRNIFNIKPGIKNDDNNILVHIAGINQPSHHTLAQQQSFWATCTEAIKQYLSIRLTVDVSRASYHLHLTFRILRYALLLVSFTVFFSSCKKILNVDSPNAVGNNTIFTSVSGLRNARIGMYSSL